MSERRLQPRDAFLGEPPRVQLTTMIVGTFREMPGLALLLPEAARLFGLREGTCQVVLEDLVGRGQLRRAADGRYRRNVLDA